VNIFLSFDAWRHKKNRGMKMPFSDVLTDVVCVLKRNGEEICGIRASVQKKKIFAIGCSVLIESGDLIRRTMSNGGVEIYKVVDPGFYESVGGIPAGYQMDVVRVGDAEAPSVGGHFVFNITGDNARVNANSVDMSMNVYHEQGKELIEELRYEIKNKIKNLEERNDALQVVGEIECQMESAKPNRTILKSLMASLPAVDSIASIAASLSDIFLK